MLSNVASFTPHCWRLIKILLKYLAGTDAQIYLRALVVFALLHRCKKKRGQDGTASSDLVQDWKIVSVNLERTSAIKSLGNAEK